MTATRPKYGKEEVLRHHASARLYQWSFADLEELLRSALLHCIDPDMEEDIRAARDARAEYEAARDRQQWGAR